MTNLQQAFYKIERNYAKKITDTLISRPMLTENQKLGEAKTLHAHVKFIFNGSCSLISS